MGQIDPESNKQSLLNALTNKSDYFGVRVEAAEALATTRDRQVLKALERHSGEEKDSFVPQN
ncbi:MAG: HEAT repeat domain-containing protein [Pyrinomonadaceae bacterium]